MVQSFFPVPPLIRPGGVPKNGLKKDVILSHSFENRISLSTAIYGDLFWTSILIGPNLNHGELLCP